MERKLRNATAKLRNLKDFLSSTRSMNSGPGPSSPNSSYHQNKRRNSKGSPTGSGMPPVSSISLFDLVEPCSRPSSVTLSALANGGSHAVGSFNQNSTTSVSMYGLASVDMSNCPGSSSTNSRPNPTIPSKNPAVRLFYTIRSKLRRRRERLSKNVDSKSTDFAQGSAFASGSQGRLGEIGGTPAEAPTSHFRLEGSHSVDQLNYISSAYEDETFGSPLGSRDRNYGKENAEPQMTTATSCFVISDNTNTYESNQMDQHSAPALHFESPLQVSESDHNSIATSSATSAPAQGSSVPLLPPKQNRLKGLAKELFDLIHYGWYWGGLSKEDAEAKLKNEPDGAFVVRDSSSSVHILSLSFNSNGKTKHTRIDYVDCKFCFLGSETEAFPSVAELIEHWISNSEEGVFCYAKAHRNNAPTSYPVRLTKPISRFTEVKSLQFLSSFVLYQYTRLDLIPKLPLPPQLIEFVGQQRYF